MNAIINYYEYKKDKTKLLHILDMFIELYKYVYIDYEKLILDIKKVRVYKQYDFNWKYGKDNEIICIEWNKDNKNSYKFEKLTNNLNWIYKHFINNKYCIFNQELNKWTYYIDNNKTDKETFYKD